MRKGEPPEVLGFAPVASLVAAVRAEAVAERKTDLAAMLAMLSSGRDSYYRVGSCQKLFLTPLGVHTKQILDEILKGFLVKIEIETEEDGQHYLGAGMCRAYAKIMKWQ
nr:hypothetical protein Iba_chr14aCG3100 [Ipomoea batatas]GMD93112.1 hypothetical protein Iba_chr14fCG4270 [Ipomoea batatas]GME12023.1 hypothetical protein Iba_scaffold13135CG0060 [Ipomoea batatas]